MLAMRFAALCHPGGKAECVAKGPHGRPCLRSAAAVTVGQGLEAELAGALVFGNHPFSVEAAIEDRVSALGIVRALDAEAPLEILLPYQWMDT